MREDICAINLSSNWVFSSAPSNMWGLNSPFEEEKGLVFVPGNPEIGWKWVVLLTRLAADLFCAIKTYIGGEFLNSVLLFLDLLA